MVENRLRSLETLCCTCTDQTFPPPIMSNISDRLSNLKTLLEGLSTDETITTSESTLSVIDIDLMTLFFIIKRKEYGKPFPTGYPHEKVYSTLRIDLGTLQRQFGVLEGTRRKVLELKHRFAELGGMIKALQDKDN
jgi:hypothetical protein